MHGFKQLSAVFILFMMLSCGPALPKLDGIDLLKWKNDRNGCVGDRLVMLASIQKEKSKLEGLTETQISGLLGRPDQNELYKRNQKFYHYFIQPGPGCNQPLIKPIQLSIRFNATERAKEVVIE